MIQRILNPIISRSFFLFGARGTGKTTWLEANFVNKNVLWIDLLNEDMYEEYSISPQRLKSELEFLKENKKLPKYIVIDEVQRVPSLLNVVQQCIQKYKLIFILTGSSARKLKRGSANLLGGRANQYELYPFSVIELGDNFNLDEFLNWGSLPEILEMKTTREKKAYLKSYCLTYLKEEILLEQLIRKLPPFRKFLNILAQSNGKLINYEKFSRQVGVDNKTVQSYIEILEDTYLGLLLRPLTPSLRKNQLKSPKFYFFDTGIIRQLAGYADSKLIPKTSLYGDLFESFVIYEIYKLNHYLELDYNLSFFTTKNGFEIDLILSKAKKRIFIEIKSTETIDEVEVKHIDINLMDITNNNDMIFYISKDKKNLKIGRVLCSNYLSFLKNLYNNLAIL